MQTLTLGKKVSVSEEFEGYKHDELDALYQLNSNTEESVVFVVYYHDESIGVYSIHQTLQGALEQVRKVAEEDGFYYEVADFVIAKELLLP